MVTGEYCVLLGFIAGNQVLSTLYLINIIIIILASLLAYFLSIKLASIISKSWCVLILLLVCDVLIYCLSLALHTIVTILGVLVCSVSSSVILFTLYYLSLIESSVCIYYIVLFIIVMLSLISLNNYVITFCFWDYLGIISYACIHFWCSKIRSGIKAILYNKFGDVFFFLYITNYYSNYFAFLYGDYLVLCNMFWLMCIISSNYRNSLLSGILFILMVMMYSKSAQIPFFTWLENAMLAPTPISALLHSSTMVISGVVLGFLCLKIVFAILYYLFWGMLFVLALLSVGLIGVLIKGIIISNVKSIIAYSTITQITYMFIVMMINGILVIFHLIVHGIYKSMMFIVCGNVIHCSNNFQSIFLVRCLNICMKLSVLIVSLVMIGVISKEDIIFGVINCINGIWVGLVYVFGGILTAVYILNLFWCVNSIGLDYEWVIFGSNYIFADGFIFFIYGIVANNIEIVFTSIFWLHSVQYINYKEYWNCISKLWNNIGVEMLIFWVWIWNMYIWNKIWIMRARNKNKSISFSTEISSCFGIRLLVLEGILYYSIDLFNWMVNTIEVYVNGNYSLWMGWLGYIGGSLGMVFMVGI